MSSTAWLVLPLLLAPGAFVWLSGRRMRRHADDPTLSQRRSQATALAVVFGGLALFLAVRVGVHWAVAMALFVPGIVAGGFESRRLLFDETWTMGQYLAWTARWLVGSFGFWIGLAVAPALIVDAAWERLGVPTVAGVAWPVALALGVVLLVWAARFSDVMLELVRARPVEPDVIEGGGALIERSAATDVRLHRAGPDGANWPQAFALPRRKPMAVLFGETLLEKLEPDEQLAVLGHEVAHLEHHAELPAWRARVTELVLVGLSCGVAPYLAAQAGESSPLVVLLWMPLIAVTLGGLLAGHRSHEADADRRGVELCGSGDALARALVEIHDLSAAPRRLTVEEERVSSHPSLARRLQAIRALDRVGEAPAEHARSPVVDPALGGDWSGEETVVRCARDASAAAILAPAHAYWLRGLPADAPGELGAGALVAAARSVERVAYSGLRELVLRPHFGGTRLIGTDIDGRRCELHVAPADAACVEAALTKVDVQLGEVAPQPSAVATRLIGALCALAPLAGFASYALVPFALWAGARPRGAGLAALRAALIASAGLSVLGFHGVLPFEQLGHAAPLLALALAIVPALGERGAARMRAEWTADSWWWMGLCVLATSTALAMLALHVLPLDDGASTRLHFVSRALPETVLFAVGLAAAVASLMPGRARLSAWLIALLGVPSLVAGTQAFGWAFARDVLVDHEALRIHVDDRELEVVQQQVFHHPVGALRLSPDATRWLVLFGGQWGPQARGADVDWLAEGRDVDAEIHARLVEFLDDDRVLALANDDGGLRLSEVGLEGAGEPRWTQQLPLVLDPVLHVDEDGTSWSVGGLAPDGQVAVRHAGSVGSESFETESWSVPDHFDDVLVGARGAPVAVWTRDDGGRDRPLRRTGGVVPRGWSTSFRYLDGDAERTSLLYVDCHAAVHDMDAPACTTEAGSAAWSLGSSTAEPRLLAKFPKPVDWVLDWGPGDRMLAWIGDGPVLVDTQPGVGVALPVEDPDGWCIVGTVTRTHVALLEGCALPELRVYSLSPRAAF